MTMQTLPGWLRPLNRVLTLLQRVGIVTGPVHLLTVPGRISGRPRTTPVSPLTVERRRYVIAALPEADWARNARAAGRGERDPAQFTAASDRVAVFEVRG